ncbi:hypothetical protein [Glutamicibacter arilaitensis]|uniref:hypothetical protein n=1 Tax=Glutamicibacter arilaitensis TaxID=256701 RepID=UPI00384C6367
MPLDWVLCSEGGKRRSRFAELSWDGFNDDPRPGRPATITTARVEDIVGLYLGPPECATLFSIDEVSQVRVMSKPQPAFALVQGMSEKRTHDYARRDNMSLFAKVTRGPARRGEHRSVQTLGMDLRNRGKGWTEEIPSR